MTNYSDRLLGEMIDTYNIGMGYVWVLDADKQEIKLIVEDSE